MESPGLGQLLGEVVLEHEGLDGQRGWPLLLAVAKDWSAFCTTPCSNRDGKGSGRHIEPHMRGHREAETDGIPWKDRQSLGCGS